jgi:hypothetical protein
MDIYLYAVVMTFGVLVAGTGLLLLFLRKEQGENRIKLFGQEFQISTPALVVFLVGCGVFIIPLVLPIQNQVVASFGHSDGPLPSPDPLSNKGKSITNATLITTGITYKGLIATDQDRDFFKFKTSGQELKMRVILRKPAPGGFSANVVVSDAVEKNVASGYAFGEDAVSFSFDCSANSYYYVKVEGLSSGSHGSYELLVKAE